MVAFVTLAVSNPNIPFWGERHFYREIWEVSVESESSTTFTSMDLPLMTLTPPVNIYREEVAHDKRGFEIMKFPYKGI